MAGDLIPPEVLLELQHELKALVRGMREEAKSAVRGAVEEAVQESKSALRGVLEEAVQELGLRGPGPEHGLLGELRGLLREQRRALRGRHGPLTVAEVDPRRAASAPEGLQGACQPLRTTLLATPETLTLRAAASTRDSQEEQPEEMVLPGVVTPPPEHSCFCQDDCSRDAGTTEPQCLSSCGSSSHSEHGAGDTCGVDHVSLPSSHPKTPQSRGNDWLSESDAETGAEKPQGGASVLQRSRRGWLPPVMAAASRVVRSSVARLGDGSVSPTALRRSSQRSRFVWQEGEEDTVCNSSRPETPGSQLSAATPHTDFSACSNFSVRPDSREAPRRHRALARDQPGPRVSRISIVHGLKRRSSEWTAVVTYESAFMLLRSNLFDYIVCAVLFLNAFTIGMQVDHAARHLGEAQPRVFKHLEVIFCFIFLGELLLRLYVYRSRFFVLPHGRWNLLDLIVVSTQAFEMLMVAIFEDTDVTLPNFQLLRFLRLIRILRLLRLINVIQELNKLVYLILGSLWSFLWTTALLMLLTLVGGVFFTQLVADHLNSFSGPPSDVTELRRFFGSLGDAILSLLAATTGGVDWMDVLRPLMVHMPSISFLLALLFMLYIAFSVLVVMNLVTGVFVDGAKRLTNLENEKDLIKKVKRTFAETDVDNSQLISWREFRMQLDSPFMKDFFNSVDIDQSQAATLFSLLDNDSTFSLSIEEFVQGALRLRGAAKAFDLAALQHENRRQADLLRSRLERQESMLRRILLRMSTQEEASPLQTRPQRGVSAPPQLHAAQRARLSGRS